MFEAIVSGQRRSHPAAAFKEDPRVKESYLGL